MKKRCIFSVFSIVLAALFCVSSPVISNAAASQKARGFEEIALAIEALIPEAEKSILAGVASVELLLKSSKTEASEMTGAWNTVQEQFFNSSPVGELRVQLTAFRMTMLDEKLNESDSKTSSSGGSGAPERSAKGARITREIANDIYNEGRELADFAQEILSVGEAVAWTLKVNRHIQSLKFDIENAPVRVGVYVKEMREVSALLVEIIAKVKRGVELRKRVNVSAADLAVLRNEVAQSLKSVVLMRAGTVNAALSLANTTKYLEPGEGYVVPEAEAKRIAVLAEYWKDAKNLYPLVRSDILDAVAKWAFFPKLKWEVYGETRQRFVDVYGPLLAGNIFKGIPLFEGKKYIELPAVVVNVENTLRALLVNIDDLQKDMEQRRKALEQEELLTRSERVRLTVLSNAYSPVMARNLVVAATRAGGGANRILELERLKRGVAKDSEEYTKYDVEQKLLQSRKHPEQLKADAAVSLFLKGLEDARKTAKDIVEKHTARRKALGLPPALKEITLAKN